MGRSLYAALATGLIVAFLGLVSFCLYEAFDFKTGKRGVFWGMTFSLFFVGMLWGYVSDSLIGGNAFAMQRLSP